MRVLIVGAGVAGPTLAYWLRRTGHDVTIVERAPRLREGGYLLDFWGAGFDVAERMGIVPQLMARGYHVREVREVSRSGQRVAAFDPRRMLDLAGGRFVSLARSDLARAIYETVESDVETVFGDTVLGLRDDGDRVRVEFEKAPSREFDFVIGADGLHSRVRTLAFGPEEGFARHVGVSVAAFDLEGYRPREELVAVSHTEAGAQTLRVALHDDATMICFMFRDAGVHDRAVPLDDLGAQQEFVRTRMRGIGWEVPAMLERMPEARTFYLDRASQIRMPLWSRGRVALVGDAAACPSLLAGQGSALAMIEAYVLACELHAAEGDHARAFRAYEQRLMPFVRKKQNAALASPRPSSRATERNCCFGTPWWGSWRSRRWQGSRWAARCATPSTCHPRRDSLLTRCVRRSAHGLRRILCGCLVS